MSQPDKPFCISNPYKRGIKKVVVGLAQPVLQRTLGLSACNHIYSQVHNDPRLEKNFTEKVLEFVGVSCRASRTQLESIPKTGPLIVVANHPFGGIEGLAMIAMLQRIRPDVKVMANYFLNSIPDMRDLFFAVDPFGGEESAKKNISVIKEACRWVKNGGVLGMFPAGEVSHLKLSPKPVVADPEWIDHVGKLVRLTKADVQCMYFPGKNSMWFQLAGLLHPKLRTLLLPREFLRYKNSPIDVKIGTPISYKQLERYENPADLTSYLRVRTYVLASQCTDKGGRPAVVKTKKSRQKPIIASIEKQKLNDELANLTDDELLLSTGPYSVYAAKAARIPNMMREIGRLRELTFREVGEGTGRSIDIDKFDDWYYHLFVWHDEDQEIVGAYRLGLTDEILPAYGKKGLYTNDLFRLRGKLLEEVSPAIEMGRSFVQPRYQKNFNSLGLLWKGIGEFIYRRPSHVRLFGAVSISEKYHSMSKALLLHYLRENHFCNDFESCIAPKHRPKYDNIRYWGRRENSVVAQDLKSVNGLIEEIDEHFEGMPVLIRQYIRMRCKFLGFNIDPEFGNSLDGLILMDITDSPESVRRYIGRKKTAAILAANGKSFGDDKDDKTDDEE